MPRFFVCYLFNALVPVALLAACAAPAPAPPAAEQASATPLPASPTAPPPPTPTAQQGSVVTSAPPPPPVREPAGYLLYSLQEDPVSEVPHEEVWRTTASGTPRLLLLNLPPNRAFDGVAVAPDATRFAYVVQEVLSETDESAVSDQLILLNIEASVAVPDFLGGSNGSADALLAEGDLYVWPNAFSPDGTKLVFAAQAGLNGPAPTALWVVDAARGAEPRQVTPDYPMISQPAWLDNDTLIFSPAQVPNVFTQTLRVDTKATPAQPPELLVDGAMQALSPDKTKLFVLYEPSSTNISPQQSLTYALISLAGGSPEVLREWEAPLGNFAWSPDGTMLAQTTFTLTPTVSLLHLDDGTTEELLSADSRDSLSRPRWAADSRRLFYVHSGTGGVTAPRQLYSLDLANKTTSLIVSGTSDDFTEVLVVPPETDGQ